MPTRPQKKFLTFTIREFFKEYLKACNKAKRKKRDYHKYKAFIQEVFAEIFSKIVHDGWHFVLPYSLGEFYIKESEWNTGERMYSRAHSIQARKPVYIFNNHTLRKTYRFLWDKSYVRHPFAKFYKFKIVRGEQAKERGVGKAFLRDHWFSVKNLPTTYDKPVKKPQDL